MKVHNLRVAQSVNQQIVVNVDGRGVYGWIRHDTINDVHWLKANHPSGFVMYQKIGNRFPFFLRSGEEALIEHAQLHIVNMVRQFYMRANSAKRGGYDG
jgi:hypothetical protein